MIAARVTKILAMAAVWLAASAVARAEPVHPPFKTDHMTAELVSETTAAAPGGVLYVAFHQKIAPGWHTYWRNPGDAGQATSLTWTLPPGWKAGDIVWPAPERFLAGPIMNYVYTDEVYLPVPIHVPANTKPGSTVTLKADADWLVCKDICIPENGTVSLTLPVAAATPAPDPRFGPAIRATLAAAPKPAGLKAAYAVRGESVKLAVVGAPVKGADVAHAYFFPYDGTVIDQAYPQLAERGPDGLTLTIPAGYAFTHHKDVKDLAGVLSLGRRAYEIDATPGPLPSGAAGLTPPAASTPAPPERPGVAAGGSETGRSGGVGLLSALGLAFLGGLLLNLFPCVFPVLSMKAAALLRHAEDRKAARAEGLAFLVGVVASFLVLAGVLIALRAGGQAVGWGFQLQSPGVVAALALVMLGAALNLSGVFEIGLSAQAVGAGLAARAGLVGAFFTGVLAVVVAAPCTVAFMATAIGWALVQPPLIALVVFVALGLGLAAPFTVLSFVPGLARRLPPPGGWMEGLKKLLAFPMYGAAAWLAWVFAIQTGVGALPLLFAAALALAFAAWVFGVAQRSAGGGALAARGAALAGLLAAVGLGVAGAEVSPPSAAAATADSTAPTGAIPTEPWSPERVAALQAQGKPVFVDFTAAWCVTCQVNERTSLATREVADAFKRTGAVYLKADWTRRDARIANALAAEGRSGVPLYLVYGRDPQPQILPQLLTPGVVRDALDRAAGA